MERVALLGGGAFRDRGAGDVAEKETLAEAIVLQEQQKGSHTSGFEVSDPLTTPK
jgi:hypothetical protein